MSAFSPFGTDQSDIDLILGEIDWKYFQGSRFFITGGTGFFGKWLLTALMAADQRYNLSCSIDVLSRNPQNFLAKYPLFREAKLLHFIEGDINSFRYPDRKFDFLIHGATDADQGKIKDHPLALFESIVCGTRRILDLARKNSNAKLLLVSSGGVYGVQPPDLLRIREDFTGCHQPSHWQAPYGEGKKVAELLCFLYAKEYGIEFAIARCFAFVGPYLPLDREYAVGNFIQNILENKDILITGDGTPFRSYLYAADLVIWLLRILSLSASGKIYNVGSDQEISIAGLAARLVDTAHLLGLKRAFKVNQSPKSDSLPARYVPDITAAKEDLSLKIYTPLDEALMKTIQFNEKLRSSKR